MGRFLENKIEGRAGTGVEMMPGEYSGRRSEKKWKWWLEITMEGEVRKRVEGEVGLSTECCQCSVGVAARHVANRHLPCGKRFVMSISHSGEDKNEMFQHQGKRRHYHRFSDIKVSLFDLLKFSIDLVSIFQFHRSINIALIAYVFDYIPHKLCLFTFSTKNKMADDHGVFLWSGEIWPWAPVLSSKKQTSSY